MSFLKNVAEISLEKKLYSIVISMYMHQIFIDVLLISAMLFKQVL